MFALVVYAAPLESLPFLIITAKPAYSDNLDPLRMFKPASLVLSAVLLAPLFTYAYVTISDPQHPPHQTEEGQFGHNDCQGKDVDSKDSKCQSKRAAF